MSDVLLGLLGLSAGAGMVAAAARSWAAPGGGRHRPGTRHARFHERAPLAYCPAEGWETPHRFDAGQRHCLVCKTTTTKEGEHGG
ncbi:hypothetical protein [Streptomyces kronopolitis]|uniref:hypothetical protein n=1 Tax=Streptomyces kronopolitis TaxID=1612435 RepID=UPI00343F97C3